MSKDAAYYESAYNPRIAVPEFNDHFERWKKRSQQAQQALASRAYTDVVYGTDPMQKLDIYRAKGESQALLIYIHGGYWRALDKSIQSFVAPPYVERGVTVASINYALCPAVRVQDIVLQVLQACAWLYRNGANFGAPRDRLFVSGHSAGGHLTAMTLAAQWPRFAPDLPKKVVQAGLSLSGVYDVEPVMNTPSVNVDVRFDAAQARLVSPALLPPATDAPLYTAVGGKEQSGFHEQNRLIRAKWKSIIKDDFACPDDNHFTILDRFADRESALFNGALKMMGVR
jgi:arylformamidase